MNRTKIMIIDDEKMACEFYDMLLKEIALDLEVPEFLIEIFRTSRLAFEEISGNVSKYMTYDFLLLDVLLRDRVTNTIDDGEHFGTKIKQLIPSLKIIVSTSIESKYRLRSILKSLKPEGFLLKYDLSAQEFKKGILAVLSGKTYYGSKVNDYLKLHAIGDPKFDDIDRKLLYLLSQGIMNKDLPNYLHLSISGVEKRKRNLAKYLELKDAKASTLIQAARDNGFV